MDIFRASTCGTFLAQASPADQANWEAILPTVDFWDFFANRSSLRHEVLMVDADMHSWELLLNQVVGLGKCGSQLAENVYAIAYDADTCRNLGSKGISCYYSVDWSNRLIDMYKRQTGQYAQLLHTVMMGRMMTTAVALCEGHNLFLSDTDVVFYRDPIQYAFHEANIMITATRIVPNIAYWGGTFFSDQPKQYYTLNNGVVFYRSNAITNAFALTLAANCVNSLQGHHDPEQGECYDCYYGHVPWRPTADQAVSPAGHHATLKIGVYPTKRYTSYCWAPTEFHESLIAAALALNQSDTSNWGWGALEGNNSRALFTHANCVDTGAFGRVRFQKKINWLRSVHSWYL
eukprot:gene7589-9090_t